MVHRLLCRAGYKTFNDPDFDYRSSCVTLETCLQVTHCPFPGQHKLIHLSKTKTLADPSRKRLSETGSAPLLSGCRNHMQTRAACTALDALLPGFRGFRV